MLSLVSQQYRTAQNIRVVPYNRIADYLGDSVTLTSEFGEDSYGFAFCDDSIASNEKRDKKLFEVDKSTALLLMTLQTPGILPDYLNSQFDMATRQGLLRLIFIGVLEVEIDGQFISGAEAATVLNEQLDELTLSPCKSISHEALQRADQLGLKYVDQLFNYLYQYNVIPATPEMRLLYQDDKQFLQLHKISKLWHYSDNMEGWHYFSLNPGLGQSKAKKTIHTSHYVAKLYISPMPEDLPATLQVTAQILSNFSGVSFKVGKGCEGILRPDKLVVYFDSLEILMDAATQLQQGLSNIRVHGVPFTSQFSQDGLISWGMDPKQIKTERQSWRQWIIEKLVEFMSTDQHSDIGPSRWKLALAQLELDGINPTTFRPGGLWITQYN